MSTQIKLMQWTDYHVGEMEGVKKYAKEEEGVLY